MKSASTDLIDLLLTKSFVSADLYTLELSDGTILRYTTADVDVAVAIDVFGADITDVFTLTDIFDSDTWSSQGALFDDTASPATAHWKTGLDVDTWQVRVVPRARDPFTDTDFPDMIGSTPWLAAAAGGFLDGAVMTVERAFLAAWPTPWVPTVPANSTGKIVVFIGRMAAVDVGRSYAILNANDYRELLTMAMPRNLYQSGCRFTLFDSGCTLVAATFGVNGSVLAVNGNEITTNIPGATGYYDLGRIMMTSGANDGFGRQVRSWSQPSQKIKMIAPFYFDVEVGDTFTIYPGCDKTMDTCNTTFANLLNFGGQPFIPAPETAI